LFSGQIFSVSYGGKLLVEEQTFLQYFAWFDKEIYHRKAEPSASVSNFFGLPVFAAKGWIKREQEEKIRRVTNEFGPPYPIDFVTASALPDYLAVIEGEVGEVRTKDWSVPETSKVESG
jgi:hypothetical protein